MKRLLLIGMTACGRVGFDGVVGDAVVSSDAPVDACTAPFGAPRNLVELNSADVEWGGALTEDRLELFFSSDRGGGSHDLYVATRSNPTAVFDAPTRIAELSSTLRDDNPFIESDGLTLWFDRDGDLFTSTRAARGAAWSAPAPVSLDDPAAQDRGVALTPDGLRIYWGSDRAPGLGDLDLYMATRSAVSEPFGAPVAVTGVSSDEQDCCAALTNDPTQMRFGSRQLSGTVMEVLLATIDPSSGHIIGGIARDSVVDTTAEDTDPFTTSDGVVLGFSSNRGGGVGNHDLYLAERDCP